MNVLLYLSALMFATGVSLALFGLWLMGLVF